MISVIFSGYNNRAVISFCRYAIQLNIPFYIISRNEQDPIHLTEYKTRIIKTRNTKNLDWNLILEMDLLIKTIHPLESIFILPTSEYLNRFLLTNQKKLESRKITFGLVNEDLYKNISDKYSFSLICKEFKIQTPREFENKPNKYPFVIKPKYYISSDNNIADKPAIIYSEKEYEKYMKGKTGKDYYFQEYVGGRSYYLLYYISKNKSYSVYSHENLIQQAEGGSMILCKSSTIHQNKIANEFAQLLIKIGFHGLIMIEVKNIKNRFIMIEANPRIWGPSQLILDSEMNLWDQFALDNNLIENSPKRKYKPDIWYFWSAGFSNHKKNIVKYGITYNEFFNNYREILKSEIYLRKDTLELYNIENELLK